MTQTEKKSRTLATTVFSLSFSFVLSFLFEGQVLYSRLACFDVPSSPYIPIAIVAHLLGLFTCGFFTRSLVMARRIWILGVVISLIGTLPFFFEPSALWLAGLAVAGYASGCSVAAWGYFLKAFTPAHQRIKSCVDVLIYSNIIMIAINVVAVYYSSLVGLVLSLLCLFAGVTLIWFIPVGDGALFPKKDKLRSNIKNPLLLLCLFVFVITINSGLMYQVINPAFSNLTGLASWYWAVPYIAALAIMRNLPSKVKRSAILYVGMAMIMAAFVCFMLMGRNMVDYLVVDTLMLGACGIFDLFWWSILGEMLSFTDNPAMVFGIGLSANVFGVLCGDIIGMTATAVQLPGAQVAVLALTVVCITLVLLPPLNRQLVLLLKNHVYLAVYDRMTSAEQATLVQQTKTLDPLTARE